MEKRKEFVFVGHGAVAAVLFFSTSSFAIEIPGSTVTVSVDFASLQSVMTSSVADVLAGGVLLAGAAAGVVGVKKGIELFSGTGFFSDSRLKILGAVGLAGVAGYAVFGGKKKKEEETDEEDEFDLEMDEEREFYSAEPPSTNHDFEKDEGYGASFAGLQPPGHGFESDEEHDFYSAEPPSASHGFESGEERESYFEGLQSASHDFETNEEGELFEGEFDREPYEGEFKREPYLW